MDQSGAQWVLGAMSGTSLDGVDAALLHTDGVEIFAFGATGYRAYSEAERDVLRTGLGRWSGPEVDASGEVVLQAHIDLLSGFSADLIGFHGQTLAHAPQEGRTLQVGDGAALSRALDCPVICDFRSADVAEGGEGAPLASFYHFACARNIGATEPLGFLNLGGVGNLTWVDPMKLTPESPGALLAFDTGPANAPINDLLATRRGEAFDRDGTLAREGQVDEEAVALFLNENYFSRKPPKSLDRNDFSHIEKMVVSLSDSDAAATLTALCAVSVAAGLSHCPRPPKRILVTGGGRLNPTLMEMLEAILPCPVTPIETAGLNGDMLEAQAFAYLAARSQRGLPISAPGTTGVAHPISGGRLSIPQ